MSLVTGCCFNASLVHKSHDESIESKTKVNGLIGSKKCESETGEKGEERLIFGSPKTNGENWFPFTKDRTYDK